MGKKILIIAAHPDDEILGAGGVINKYYKKGDCVHCLILGEGETSRGEDNQDEKLLELHRQGREAAMKIGIDYLYFEKIPDQKFDSIDFLDIVKVVEKYIKQVKPDIVYTHYENDLNLDHKLTYQAVMTACRPCNDLCPKEIYSFEVLSSTEWQLEGEKFKPNIYVNIENEIEEKINALKEYKSELRDYPYSRSVEGVRILAQCRGLECNKRYAEAFKLIRIMK